MLDRIEFGCLCVLLCNFRDIIYWQTVAFEIIFMSSNSDDLLTKTHIITDENFCTNKTIWIFTNSDSVMNFFFQKKKEAK